MWVIAQETKTAGETGQTRQRNKDKGDRWNEQGSNHVPSSSSSSWSWTSVSSLETSRRAGLSVARRNLEQPTTSVPRMRSRMAESNARGAVA